MLFGALVKMDELKYENTFFPELKCIALKKTSNYTLFYDEKFPLCPVYNLILLTTLTSIPQILRKD